MDNQDKHRFVQDYVQQQQAYLSNYSADGLLNDGTGTPSKQLRSAQIDEFGFDTPVLRPRVSKIASWAQPTPQLKPSQKQRRDTKPDTPREQSPALPDKAPPSERFASRDDSDRENQKLTPKKTDKGSRPKPKTSLSLHTNDELDRAARLADRRERKRKKRAIVNPAVDHDGQTTSAKLSKAKKPKGKKEQKASTPAALALLHGFSATNVTKDRLTLRSAPSLGVFGKGKASVKTKVSVAKKSVPRNKGFSEYTFLNKAEQRAAESSEDESADGSVSSTPSAPPLKRIRITNYDASSRKKNANKAVRTPPSKGPEPLSYEHAKSDVWDIELQSPRPSPSPLHKYPRESDVQGSASVVLDLRGSEWFASRDVAEGNANEMKTLELPPFVQDQLRKPSTEQDSVLDRSEGDARALPRDADASSLHPSHSASQVGHPAKIQPPAFRLVASEFFPQYKPVSAHEPTTEPSQHFEAGGSIDVLESPPTDVPHGQIMDQRAGFTSMNAHISPEIASPENSLPSVLRPISEFRTPHDLATPEILNGFSDVPSYNSSYRSPQVQEDLREIPNGHHYVWPPHVGTPSSPLFEGNVQEFGHPSQREQRDCYRPSRPSYPPPFPASDLSRNLSSEHPKGTCDTEQIGYCDDDYEEQALLDGLESVDDSRYSVAFEVQHWDELDEHFLSQPGHSTTRDEQNLYQYEYRTIDAEDGHPDRIYDSESTDGMEPSYLPPDFLEGRALLLGLSEHSQRTHPNVGSSGLVQAEMDVASRLRDHWRPQRL
ncbi:hypothetical protein BDN67DRAFT_400268 [Paxillus ammoniavirescens]|nr:hypothetical protein BDN67DRAFT_400268 [Paxillus ammoniavirescens]